MIKRYQRPIMRKLWSDKHKFTRYLDVEKAVCAAWMELGLFDSDTYEKILQASFSLSRIEAIEKEVRHDVIAFLQAVGETLGDERKYLHYGLTSTDVVDTAHALILRDVNRVIEADIDAMMDVLKEKADLYQDQLTIGRTHGIHAEVTSFGLKFVLWYEDFKRLKRFFVRAARAVEVGMISGAVGNYSAHSPELEQIALRRLDLPATKVSTQVLQRDRHANYVAQLALLGSQLEKMAVEIRHLSKTEVGEVEEAFFTGQKGSSAMPHKRNPITSENIAGLSRVIRGYMLSTYENIALWHERDISHSSVERIVLTDATTLIDYMLQRFTKTLEHLRVNPARMKKNIDMTQGVIHAERIMHALIDHGFDRLNAYEIIQKISHEALEQEMHIRKLIEKDPVLSTRLSADELDRLLDLKHDVRHVEAIYRRVFETPDDR
jgi:adenylosuccinate lyase